MQAIWRWLLNIFRTVSQWEVQQETGLASMKSVQRKKHTIQPLQLLQKISSFSCSEGGIADGVYWVLSSSSLNRILYQEIDYLNEASNADRFRRDFRNQNWVRVPVSFSSKSGSKFLYVFILSCIQKWVQVPVHFSFWSCIQNWVRVPILFSFLWHPKVGLSSCTYSFSLASKNGSESLYDFFLFWKG